MEPGRMPLSAPRHPLSQLGPSRGERPRRPVRADAPVHRLLRGGQSAKWQVRPRLLPRVQRRQVREFPEGATATSFTQPEDGGRSRQCTLPPRQTPQAAAPDLSGASRIVIPAALQPPARPDREGLEAHPSSGNPQSLLPQPGRVAGRCRDLLWPMAKTEPRPAKTIRHSLRRCV